MSNYLIAVDIDGVLIPTYRRRVGGDPRIVGTVVDLFDSRSVANVVDLLRDVGADLALVSSWLQHDTYDPGWYRWVFRRAGFHRHADTMIVPPQFDLGNHHKQVCRWFDKIGVHPNRLLWIDDFRHDLRPETCRWEARHYRPLFGRFTGYDREMARCLMSLWTGDGRHLLLEEDM